MSLLRTMLAITSLMVMSFPSVSQDAESEELASPAEPTPRVPDTRTLDEIFIPSQEIDADEEIVFPVNI